MEYYRVIANHVKIETLQERDDLLWQNVSLAFILWILVGKNVQHFTFLLKNCS